MFALRLCLLPVALVTMICFALLGSMIALGQSIESHTLILVSSLITQNQVYFYDVEQESLRSIFTLPVGGLVETPALSTDRTRIAYVLRDGTQYHLYASNLLGHARRIFSLDQPAYDLHWSPNGNWLAVTIGGNSTDVRLIDVNNGQSTHIGLLKFDNRIQSLSPDGRWLVITVIKDSAEIYFVDMSATPFVPISVLKFPASALSWSPDGNQLVFSASHDRFDRLYSLTPETGRLRLLAEHESSLAGMTTDWSPDGAQIVYSVAGDLWVADVLENATHRLTQDELGNTTPYWSPDGAQIVFHSSRNMGMLLYIVNADGSDIRDLNAQPVGRYEAKPIWSPDGAYVAFAGVTAGETDVYLNDVTGIHSQHITPDSPNCQCSPDYYVLGWIS